MTDGTVVETINMTTDVFQAKYIWYINNFQYGNHEENFEITNDIQCTVKMCTDIEKNGRAFWFVIFKKIPAVAKTYSGKFKFECNTVGYKVISFLDWEKIALKDFRCERNFITNNNYKEFLNKGSLEMEITFFIHDLPRYKSWDLNNFKTPATKFVELISNAYLTDNNPDIALICANDEVVMAHKVILASRSCVFTDNLTLDTKTYDLGEFTKDAVTEFMRFLYQDQIHPNNFEKCIAELHQLAAKFMIPQLTKITIYYFFVKSKQKVKRINGKLANITMEEFQIIENLELIYENINQLSELTNKIK